MGSNDITIIFIEKKKSNWEIKSIIFRI